ncbi:Hemolymph lipopolysaccharide-binding protein [Gryllus bimaculatus]|nr:Hemolymph lipopolysaccharide-binding protein [Gryllus bimaculatus]
MRTRSLLPRSEGSGVEFPAERSSFGAARLSSAADDASRDLDRTIHTKDSKKQTNKASGSGHKGSSGHAGRSPLPRSEEEVGPCGRSSAGRCVSPVASRRVAAGATTGLQQALAFALYKLAQVLRRRHTLLRWTLRGDHGLDALLLLLLVTATRRSSVRVREKVTLSLDYSPTPGPSKINARLEHAMESAGWSWTWRWAHRRAALAACSGRRSPSPSTAPRNYVTLPGLGHFRAPSVALDWLAARDLCRTERAQLAVPASQREVEVVLAHFALNASGATHLEYVWHGTNDFAQEGKWVTDDDVLLENTGFSKFHPGQPSGGNAENCLVLVKSSKLLADAPCSWRLPYICKAAL